MAVETGRTETSIYNFTLPVSQFPNYREVSSDEQVLFSILQGMLALYLSIDLKRETGM